MGRGTQDFHGVEGGLTATTETASDIAIDVGPALLDVAVGVIAGWARRLVLPFSAFSSGTTLDHSESLWLLWTADEASAERQPSKSSAVTPHHATCWFRCVCAIKSASVIPTYTIRPFTTPRGAIRSPFHVGHTHTRDRISGSCTEPSREINTTCSGSSWSSVQVAAQN